MAKIAFTKLGLVKNTDIKTIEWKDQHIEVKQYLPVQEKFNLISAVLNQVQDENNFINEAKIVLYTELEIIYHYTNISFTDKQKEDPGKLYDLFVSSGLIENIKNIIPKEELDKLYDWVISTAKHVYEYRNSIYGIIDTMRTNYNSEDFNIKQLIHNLQDSDELGLIKEIAPLLNS